MNDQIRFVEGTPDDPVAVALLDRYFDELAARFPAGFDQTSGRAAPNEMSGPHGAFVLALAGGETIACGGLRHMIEGTAEIKHMWVDPQWRGQGVARELLATLERTAADLGYRQARLDTSVHLPEAVALYRSSGWQETEPYNDNPYAGHWFVKELG